MPEQVNSVYAQEAAKFPRAMAGLFVPLMPDGVTPVRYRVPYGGRGGAKSWNIARALLMNASQKTLSVLCGREYQNSIKDSVHKLLAQQIDALKMNYIYEVQNAVIKAREGALLPSGAPNESEFIFKGFHQNMDEVKSTEGVDICWVEEAKNLSKTSFNFLDPTIRKDGSEIWLSFNPELETDFVYDHFVLNPPPDALVWKVTWRDNPWFNSVMRSQMEHMRANDMDSYLNTWEGECRLMLEGAVYADELRSMRASGRICTVPYDPNYPVDVIADLGYADATALLFRQQIAYEVRFIRAYQRCQEDLEHFLDYIQGTKYAIGTIWLPHDAKAKRLGTKLTIQEQFWHHFGAKKVRIVPKLGIADGINATRQGFRKIYADKVLCADWLQAMAHYRYEVVQELKNGQMQLSKNPVHDEYSHFADTGRYEAISRKLGAVQIDGSARSRSDLQERIDNEIATGLFSQGRPERQGPQSWMRG